jgi:hypothetical protein
MVGGQVKVGSRLAHDYDIHFFHRRDYFLQVDETSNPSKLRIPRAFQCSVYPDREDPTRSL